MDLGVPARFAAVLLNLNTANTCRCRKACKAILPGRAVLGQQFLVRTGLFSGLGIFTAKFMPHMSDMNIVRHVLRQVSGLLARVGQVHLCREQVMLPFLPDPLMMERVFSTI
jgi:hypothetical protein